PKQRILAHQVALEARDVRERVQRDGAVAHLAELLPGSQAPFSKWCCKLVIAHEEGQPGSRRQSARLQCGQVRRRGLMFCKCARTWPRSSQKPASATATRSPDARSPVERAQPSATRTLSSSRSSRSNQVG